MKFTPLTTAGLVIGAPVESVPAAWPDVFLPHPTTNPDTVRAMLNDPPALIPTMLGNPAGTAA